MKKFICLAVILLSGCTTQADRLAKCQSLGVSIDTCYAKDMDRQTAMETVYQKQALKNSAKALDEAEHKNHPAN